MTDCERAMRDYLRDTATTLDRRVFFRLPRKTKYPAVTVARAGGGDDGSDAPVDLPSLAIEVWGIPPTAQDLGDRQTTRAAVEDVRNAIRTLSNKTYDGTRLLGATCAGDFYNPDPDTGQPRYSLTVSAVAAPA